MTRRTGFAHLPLHSGRAPAWLFIRMARLAREIAVIIVSDHGPDDLVRRLADPFWFQAFGCVLGFDWHSSGVTTTVTGALKEGLRHIGDDLGVFSHGGKGATSRKTPTEILDRCHRLSVDPNPYLHASRMAAKVDSAAVQDGYQLYHHAFFFTRSGHWCVVQQGMNDATRTARRYHWLSSTLSSFVEEPHAAICSDHRAETVNLVSAEHAAIRTAITTLAADPPDRTLRVLQQCAATPPAARLPAISDHQRSGRLPFDEPTSHDPSTNEVGLMPASAHIPTLDLPRRHALLAQDIDPRRLHTVLLSTYERAPEDFATLLGLPGVGARTLRALTLVSELVYGTAASLDDPARFAFAHGGKDGIPFPVDRETYDRTIDTLHRATARARVDLSDKRDALKRLARFTTSDRTVL